MHTGEDASSKLLGKIAYMSPEHLEGKVIDNRSDLFGVALVMAEILLAQRMQVATEKEKVLENIKRGDYPALSDSKLDLSLKKIILKALS
ncbi:MAG: hypothetical protein HQM16_19395 [Deltaproteobacteria bacterium]|nr:hypothetical protein [Deltaproteobacteria bacterium]